MDVTRGMHVIQCFLDTMFSHVTSSAKTPTRMLLNFPAYSFPLKRFTALKFIFSDIHRKTSHFVCLKGDTTIIQLSLVKHITVDSQPVGHFIT